jgi:hypothetical protein
VAETETPAESAAPSAATRRRRAASRRKTARRKSPARRKKTSRARAGAGGTLAALLNDMAAKAGSAGKGLKTLSGQGAGVARRALRGAGAASRKTIARLTKEWERMDTRRRAQFVAALLAALAAASAPIVRGRLKK